MPAILLAFDPPIPSGFRGKTTHRSRAEGRIVWNKSICWALQGWCGLGSVCKDTEGTLLEQQVVLMSCEVKASMGKNGEGSWPRALWPRSSTSSPFLQLSRICFTSSPLLSSRTWNSRWKKPLRLPGLVRVGEQRMAPVLMWDESCPWNLRLGPKTKVSSVVLSTFPSLLCPSHTKSPGQGQHRQISLEHHTLWCNSQPSAHWRASRRQLTHREAWMNTQELIHLNLYKPNSYQLKHPCACVLQSSPGFIK